jgi:hypothetical protein
MKLVYIKIIVFLLFPSLIVGIFACKKQVNITNSVFYYYNYGVNPAIWEFKIIAFHKTIGSRCFEQLYWVNKHNQLQAREDRIFAKRNDTIFVLYAGEMFGECKNDTAWYPEYAISKKHIDFFVERKILPCGNGYDPFDISSFNPTKYSTDTCRNDTLYLKGYEHPRTEPFSAELTAIYYKNFILINKVAINIKYHYYDAIKQFKPDIKDPILGIADSLQKAGIW